jgi:hypothetical protein
MLSRKDVTTAGVEPIDIKLVDVISRIQIRFEGINNGHTPTAHPAKQVSKIELVDGSDVLMSLTGMEAEALSFYETHRSRPYEIDYRDDMFTEQIFDLNFGRWLFDPQLAFDPNRFTNPQLKITHNKASGGSSPDAGYLTVWADIFDEKRVSPLGWLMAKEHYTYTPTASSYKDIDLPDDYILKRMLIQSLHAPNTFTNNIDEIRIDEENLKKVPLDLDMFIYMSSVMNVMPLYEEIIAVYTANGNKTVYVTPGEYPAYIPNVYSGTAAYVNAERGGGEQVLTSTAVSMSRGLVKGYMPHGCLPIEFGDQWDMSDWYDITRIKNLNLRLHHPSSVGGDVNIVLQQLRRY